MKRRKIKFKMAAPKSLVFVMVTLTVVVLIEKYALEYQSILYLIEQSRNYLPEFVNMYLQNDRTKSLKSTGEIFTTERLALYDGSEDSRGLHLAFLGRVYDVSGKGDQFYAPGGGYSFFAGRDATRAFITGEFTEEGLKDNVDGFNLHQMGEVMEWVEFYETEYKRVGECI